MSLEVYYPGFRSGVYLLTGPQGDVVLENVYLAIESRKGRLVNATSDHIRLQSRYWANALSALDLESIRSGTALLLTTATEPEADDIAAGITKALEYFTDHELSYQEVSGSVLRNLYYLYDRPYTMSKRGEVPQPGFYYEKLAFILFILEAWAYLQTQQPQSKRNQFRLC